MTVTMFIYHSMSVLVIGILFWLFIKEDKSWENSVLYLIAILPFLIRVLRIH